MNLTPKKTVSFLLKRRLLVFICIGLITLLAGTYASRVSFDSSIEIWFLEDDSNLVTYHKFLDRFEADEIVVIGVFSDDVFSSETLASVDRITKAAEDAPYAHRVRSLTNIRVAQGYDDTVEIAPLIKSLPQSTEEIETLRQRVLNTEWLRGLVAQDSKATAVLVELDPKGNSFQGKKELVDALRKIAQKESGHVRTYMSGSPPLDEAFFVYSRRDFKIIGTLAALLVILIIYFIFRQFVTAFIPLFVVCISLIWTYGIMGVLGININMISTSVGVLIVAVGVADSIHILSDYYHQLARGGPKEECIKASFASLMTPCFFTTATTVAGMLSLLSSQLKPIREFGWLAALGVMIAFILTMTFVPTFLSYVSPPHTLSVKRLHSGIMLRLLNWLGRPTRSGSFKILLVSVLLLFVSVWGITKLTVGANVLHYFKKDDPVAQAIYKVEEVLGGSAGIEFFVHTSKEGLKDPVTLKRLEGFQQWVEDLEGVTQALSVVDSLKDLNKVFHEGDPLSYILPDSRPLVSQYYLLLEGEDDFESFVQEDYSITRVSARAEYTRADILAHNIPKIEAYLDREFNDPSFKVELTGFVKLMGDMENYLLQSQIKSFSIAFLIIICMMALLLRSIKLGLFSMIPNILPIVMGLAFMAWTSISLNPGTVMIGSITMGLVVDDTIHFLARLQQHFAADLTRSLSMEQAIFKTMQETGRPIIATSVALSLGCLVLVFGSFNPNIQFGLVTALVIMVALICDLVVVPAALMVIRPKV